MPYQDGTFTSAVQNGPKQIFYPFLNSPTKDSTTKGTIRTMVSLPNYYATLAALSTDPDDSTQYLIEETEPQIDSAIARWQRTYCKVPGDQVIYGSRVITKPNPSTLGTAIGSLIDYRTSGSTSNLGIAVSYLGKLWGNNEVYSISSTTGSVTSATGGTFTLSYKTSTTAALNYNDSGATIATALNALAAVVADGVTFTVANYLNLTPASLVLQVTAGATSSPVTMNGASLNPTASRTSFTAISGVNQYVYIAGRATIASHGFNTSNALCITYGSGGFLLSSSQWSSIDSNTIAYLPATASITGAGQFLRNYTPGTDRVGTKNTQKFYLPGVTIGITTAADIPIPSTLLNDADFLASVVANTSGYQTYDANELTTWRGSIYTQTLTDINMADV